MERDNGQPLGIGQTHAGNHGSLVKALQDIGLLSLIPSNSLGPGKVVCLACAALSHLNSQQ